MLSTPHIRSSSLSLYLCVHVCVYMHLCVNSWQVVDKACKDWRHAVRFHFVQENFAATKLTPVAPPVYVPFRSWSFLTIAEANASNLTGPLESLRAIIYVYLVFAGCLPALLPHPKEPLVEKIKALLRHGMKRACTHRGIAQVRTAGGMWVMRECQDCEGTRGCLLGTFPPKATYAHVCMTCKRRARACA